MEWQKHNRVETAQQMAKVSGATRHLADVSRDRTFNTAIMIRLGNWYCVNTYDTTILSKSETALFSQEFIGLDADRGRQEIVQRAAPTASRILPNGS